MHVKRRSVRMVLCVTLALLTLMAMMPAASFAAVDPISRTVTVDIGSDEVSCAPGKVKASDTKADYPAQAQEYSGTVTGHVDVVKLLKDSYDYYSRFYVKAKYRHFVMFSEGKTFPVMKYTVSVPKNSDVQITDTTQSENAICLSSIKADIAEDHKSVTFTVGLGNWNDYEEFFDLYKQDADSGENPAIDFTVSYSGTADPSSSFDAVKNSVEAQGGGDLWYYGSKKSQIFLKIRTNKLTMPLYTEGAAEVAARKAPSAKVRSVKSVAGAEETTAPAQEEVTAGASDNRTMELEDLKDWIPSQFQKTAGDLLVTEFNGKQIADNDTQTGKDAKKALTVYPGDKLTFTGMYDVDNIKLALNFLNITELGEGFDLENVNCTFYAKLTLPEGMMIPEGYDVKQISFSDTNSFSIDYDNLKIEKNSITVPLVLKSASEIKNMADLNQAINGGRVIWILKCSPDWKKIILLSILTKKHLILLV